MDEESKDQKLQKRIDEVLGKVFMAHNLVHRLFQDIDESKDGYISTSEWEKYFVMVIYLLAWAQGQSLYAAGN